MKILSVICSVFTLLASQSVFADSIPLDFVKKMQKQNDDAEANQQAVWPGFNPNSGCSIFLFYDTVNNQAKKTAYAIKFEPGNLPWVKQTDSDPIYFLNDTIPLNIDYSDDGKFKTIEGQKCFVDVEFVKRIKSRENFGSKYLEARSARWLQNEAHIAPEHFNYDQVTYDTFNNKKFIALSYLEDTILSKAMQTNFDFTNAMNIVREAAAVRQYRNQLLTEDERYVETHNTFFNGIPYYITWSVKGINLTDKQYGIDVQRVSCSPLSTMSGIYGISDCLERGLPAITSTAYGKIIDPYNTTSWKNKSITQVESIADMAVDYFHLSKTDADKLAHIAMKNPDYRWKEINKIVNFIMNPYLKEMEKSRYEYEKMPGVIVRTTSKLGADLLIGNNVEIGTQFAIDNKTSLLKDINLADQNGTAWFFNHYPYMMLIKDPNNAYTEFKLNPTAFIKTDNKKASVTELLQSQNKVEFQNIQVIDKDIGYYYERSGYIEVKNNILHIVMNDSST